MMAAEAVVIDTGSYLTKAGFAGEDVPRAVFSSTVGSTPAIKDASGNSAGPSLRYPIERGIVVDWEALETLWRHMFERELSIIPEEHPVLIADRNLEFREGDREKTIEIMFETFHVPAFYVALQPLLSLYATGKTTGVVLESGDGITHSVPIYEGYPLSHAVCRLKLAGRDLTDYLVLLLQARGYQLSTTTERETTRGIKEAMCYVVENFEKEMESSVSDPTLVERTYELPDGQVITLGNECYRVAETLFQPAFLGSEDEGIHMLLLDSIAKCDVCIRRDMYMNVVISGGNTLYPGITKRLQAELKSLVHPMQTIKIADPPNRLHSPWIGGSILGSLSVFGQIWIPQKDYHETGPSIVHQRCF